MLWPATATTRLFARLVPEFLPLRVLFCGAVIFVAAYRARVDPVAERFCLRPYEVKLDSHFGSLSSLSLSSLSNLSNLRSWKAFLDFLDFDNPKPRTIIIFLDAGL